MRCIGINWVGARWIVALGATLLLALAFIACGDDDDEPAATTPAATAAATTAGADGTPEATDEPAIEPEKKTLKLGTLGGGEYFLSLYIAQNEGFYEQYGFDSVEITEFTASPDITAALVSGNIDVAVAGYSGVLLAHGAGEDVDAFYVQSSCPCYQLISSSEFTTLEDAINAGATMGVSAVGGLDWAVGRLLISRAGQDPDALTYVAAGNPTQRTEALLAGNIDLLAAVPPGSLKLVAEGQTILLDMEDALPTFPFEIAYSKADFLEQNPNTARALVLALGAAAEWARDNIDEAIDVAVEKYKPAPENMEYFDQTFRDLLIQNWPSADEPIDLDGARGLAEFYIASGVVEGPLDQLIEETWNLDIVGE